MVQILDVDPQVTAVEGALPAYERDVNVDFEVLESIDPATGDVIVRPHIRWSASSAIVPAASRATFVV